MDSATSTSDRQEDGQTEAQVRLEDVSKVYSIGMVDALCGVSFSIASGEFVALLGPSGCGKSTLLNLIGAVDKPTSGKIWLAGQCITTYGDSELARIRRERIGFVFQFFNLLNALTVFENVALPLELNGRPAQEIDERVGELLQSFAVDDRARAYPSQLSGGEMQRVAIARAIIHRPDLIIADEPTGNLDTENGRMVLEMLSRLNRESGRTIVMATHSKEAAAFATRTIFMRDGRITADEKE